MNAFAILLAVLQALRLSPLDDPSGNRKWIRIPTATGDSVFFWFNDYGDFRHIEVRHKGVPLP